MNVANRSKSKRFRRVLWGMGITLLLLAVLCLYRTKLRSAYEIVSDNPTATVSDLLKVAGQPSEARAFYDPPMQLFIYHRPKSPIVVLRFSTWWDDLEAWIFFPRSFSFSEDWGLVTDSEIQDSEVALDEGDYSYEVRNDELILLLESKDKGTIELVVPDDSRIIVRSYSNRVSRLKNQYFP